MRVLVVERSPFLRLVLREVLARANHETVGECEEIGQAANLIGSLYPDVVLLDLEGSRGRIHEAISTLRDKAPDARLIALGPPGRPAQETAGIEAYICGPWTPEAVLAAIHHRHVPSRALSV